MITVKVRSNGKIAFVSPAHPVSRGGGIGGTVFVAEPYRNGGYAIMWWYGYGACFERVETLTELIALAKAEERRIMRG